MKSKIAKTKNYFFKGNSNVKQQRLNITIYKKLKETIEGRQHQIINKK